MFVQKVSQIPISPTSNDSVGYNRLLKKCPTSLKKIKESQEWASGTGEALYLMNKTSVT